MNKELETWIDYINCKCSYGLSEASGETLPANVAILSTDQSYLYYKFTADPVKIVQIDSDAALTITSITASSPSAGFVTVGFAVDLLKSIRFDLEAPEMSSVSSIRF